MDTYLRLELVILGLKKKIGITDKKVSQTKKENLKKENSINLTTYFCNQYSLLGKYFFRKYIYRLTTISVLFSFTHAQSLNSFRPFDWVLYKNAGSITSFTEGYTFVYIGTSSGGVKRFNLYGNYFDNPLSTAQGLENNNIEAVHFDKKTGFLWISSPGYIQYSFSREDNWFTKTFYDIGLSKFDKITKIGSSNGYIWLKARASYVKLDHSSGTMVGIYPVPDEIDINWSSGKYIQDHKNNEFLANYVILDGWAFSGDDLINQYGLRAKITSIFSSQYGNIYIGTENGMVFYGSRTMETLTPIIPDIINNDVLSLHMEDHYLWIGSQNFLRSKGISKFDIKSSESSVFKFDETINMQSSPVYSFISLGNELWAGGEDMILYYDGKKDFWKTLGDSRLLSGGIMWDLCIDDRYLWMASSKGLNRLDMYSHSIELSGIEKYFRNTQVYAIEKIENDIWIGSKSGLFIYSSDDPKLINAKELQKKEQVIDNFYNFTVIKENNNLVYVAGNLGIAGYDSELEEWKLISSSVVYGGEIVYSMEINEKFLFLGTSNGFCRINIKTGQIRNYNYPFIGQVNDLILDDNVLWVGSNNGLIKFKWKRDI
tara:strand:+ start:23 stop:1822 length:1800 start_codon:yes stop_codon:yes gene_type:complete